jgi:signal transduction histidine kinase
VGLDFEPDRIVLSISDDGVGLPADYSTRGHGFRGMRAEAEALGGTLIVDDGDGNGGLTITCVIPRTADE